MESYPDQFAVVTYHATDPFYDYNPTEHLARIYYYPPHPDGNYYVPYGWIDGLIRGSYDYDNWGNMILDRYDVESPLEIQLAGNFDEETRQGNLNMTLIAHQQISQADLQVRIALTEDSLYYAGPNGTLWHNYTMRDIIPNTAGIPLTISEGETVELMQGFVCPEPLVLQYCKLIVWVQADGSEREILQTSRIQIDEMGQVSVDDYAETPSNFRLDQNYPNPFNASTTIQYNLPMASDITIDIYDILGRKVETLVQGDQQAGFHQVIWNADGFSSGVYFYKLQAGNYTETKKMVLLK